jgi:LysR family transcriptional regulator, low CO2-responsive transcriptional regulator
MKDVTLRQLRFLTEVVRTGSLAGAAERLHLTAPAIAQQVRLLEKAVGLRLIERGPGGQRATEAGRLLMESSIRIDAELTACEDELSVLRAAGAGHVTLGAVSTAKYFAPFVLAAFQKRHPNIRMALRIGNRDEVLSWLEDYEIDLAVMGRPPAGLDVEQAIFGEHPHVIIAAPDHRLMAQPGPIPLATVASETFLARERGSGTRQHLDSLFAAAGLEPAISMELASNETIKQSVMAGLGVAVISAHTIAAEVRDGRLAVLDVVGLPIRRHWLVLRMARRAVSPATRALWRFVVAEAASQLPHLAQLDPGR